MEGHERVRWSVLMGECHIETEVWGSMGRMEGDEAGVWSLVLRAQDMESHANLESEQPINIEQQKGKEEEKTHKYTR